MRVKSRHLVDSSRPDAVERVFAKLITAIFRGILWRGQRDTPHRGGGDGGDNEVIMSELVRAPYASQVTAPKAKAPGFYGLFL